MLEKNKLWQTVICFIGLVILLFLFFKYAFFGVLPILLGWLISLTLYPLATRLADRMRISRRITSGALVILFFCALLLGSGFAIKRLIAELSSFAARLESNPEIMENTLKNMSGSVSGMRIFSRFESIISSLGDYAYVVDKIINNILDSTMTTLGNFLSAAAKNIVFGIPTAILFTITLFMSAFYFCVDRDRIYGFLGSVIPEKPKEYARKFTQGGALAVLGYVKSSLILMLVTFLEMLIFLTFLRVEYSFILSIIIAIVDVLPLLGVGAVLVPWSVYSFLVGNTRLGIWLIVIFIVATVIRNVLEPKILGKRVGVHPFLIVASAYLGYMAFGGIGLVAGPLIAAAISTIKKENTLTPHK